MTKVTPANHPLLILIRGLPGSGKSYIAKALEPELAERFGSNTFINLDPDATDYNSQAYQAHTERLDKEGVDKILHPYRFLRAQAYQAIEDHKLIFWNQPFTSRESLTKVIANLQGYAKDHSTTLPVLIVEVEIDPATAKERVDQRKQAGGHGPSDKTFARFTDDYETFADMGHPTIQVIGTNQTNESVAKIMTAVAEITEHRS